MITPDIEKQYNEPQALNNVADFHDLFGLPILEQPTVPSKERCKLRISLLEEELGELKDALEDNDLIEVADALADIQYVLSGAILEFGLADKFKAVFDEVQRSNMSKACETMEVAEATQRHYQKTKGTESYIDPKEGQFLVYRKEDGKVLKSVNYSPADLKSVLDL